MKQKTRTRITTQLAAIKKQATRILDYPTFPVDENADSFRTVLKNTITLLEKDPQGRSELQSLLDVLQALENKGYLTLPQQQLFRAAGQTVGMLKTMWKNIETQLEAVAHGQGKAIGRPEFDSIPGDRYRLQIQNQAGKIAIMIDNLTAIQEEIQTMGHKMGRPVSQPQTTR